MPPSSTLSIIRYRSKVSEAIQGKWLLKREPSGSPSTTVGQLSIDSLLTLDCRLLQTSSIPTENHILLTICHNIFQLDLVKKKKMTYNWAICVNASDNLPSLKHLKMFWTALSVIVSSSTSRILRATSLASKFPESFCLYSSLWHLIGRAFRKTFIVCRNRFGDPSSKYWKRLRFIWEKCVSISPLTQPAMGK